MSSRASPVCFQKTNNSEANKGLPCSSDALIYTKLLLLTAGTIVSGGEKVQIVKREKQLTSGRLGRRPGWLDPARGRGLVSAASVRQKH